MLRLPSDRSSNSVHSSDRDPYPFKHPNQCTSTDPSMKSDETSFHCPFCERKYKRKNGLERHVNAHHLSEFRFPCSHCDKGFARSDLFRRLMKRFHPDKTFVPPAFTRRTPQEIASTHQGWYSSELRSRASSSGASTEASGSGSGIGFGSERGSGNGNSNNNDIDVGIGNEVGTQTYDTGSSTHSLQSRSDSAAPKSSSSFTESSEVSMGYQEESVEPEELEESEEEDMSSRTFQSFIAETVVKSEEQPTASISSPSQQRPPPPHLSQHPQPHLYHGSLPQQYTPNSPEMPQNGSPWSSRANMASTSAAFLVADASLSQDLAWSDHRTLRRSTVSESQDSDSHFYQSTLTPMQDQQQEYFPGVPPNLQPHASSEVSDTLMLIHSPASASDSSSFPASSSLQYSKHHENY